jgi:light-regulated signal transduction histidine kinase (bacteriophytochrome)
MSQGGHRNLRTAPIAAIQARGWAIVCDAQAATVVGYSANLPELFPDRNGAFPGAALRDLVGSETSHALRNALSRASVATRASHLPGRAIAGHAGIYDFAVHASGEQTIIEIEPSAAPDSGALDRARALIDRLFQADGLDRLALMAARLLHSMLQWDCVTLLRLAPDGAARTIARQKRADWPNPAQDEALLAPFSAEARAFVAATRLRFLSDSAAAAVPLVGVAAELSAAHLCAATADESARAGGAGFAALLTLPVLVEGELWGVLQAQDRQARNLTMVERAVFELFGDFLSLSVQSALWRQAAAEARGAHAL